MESRANEQQISSQMREGFEAYAERMKQIRSLATPTLNELRIPIAMCSRSTFSTSAKWRQKTERSLLILFSLF